MRKNVFNNFGGRQILNTISIFCIDIMSLVLRQAQFVAITNQSGLLNQYDKSV